MQTNYFIKVTTSAGFSFLCDYGLKENLMEYPRWFDSLEEAKAFVPTYLKLMCDDGWAIVHLSKGFTLSFTALDTDTEKLNKVRQGGGFLYHGEEYESCFTNQRDVK